MAIGLGLLFGIMLPINFNSPYKALNIADFWRRWHITLGRFLKEYLYIPLGGNRNDKRNPSLVQSLHTHNSPHLSMSDSSCLTHHSYANKTPNSYTLDNGMNIGDSNHRDSHTTESHLIQSQAKRDSKDSQTILESQRDSKEKEEVTQRVSQTNTESTDSHTSFISQTHFDSQTHKESQINTESYVSQTIKQSVEFQNTQYNVSRHSEGARATEESTQSESSESKQREYKNVLESQINTESIDSHTSFISQSHLDSQTLLESQDSLDIENNTESFNSHNNVESTDSQSHFNPHNVFNLEAKKEPLESTQKDSHNTIQSVESKNTDSHTTDSQTHKESQTNMESYVSQTIKQSVESQNTQYNVSRHSEGARATEESTQSESTQNKSIKKESTQKDSKQSESIKSNESKNNESKSNESIGSESKQREYKNVLESQINTEVSHTSLHNTLFNKLLTLRNLFIVAFLSGIWHGAGWGFVIWGIMHGIAMCVHRIYMWWVKELEKKCSLVGENDCLHYAHISKASSHSTDVAGDLVDLKVAITNEATPTRYSAKNSANTTITHNNSYLY